MFSCEFCKISKNTFFYRHLRWLLLDSLTASGVPFYGLAAFFLLQFGRYCTKPKIQITKYQEVFRKSLTLYMCYNSIKLLNQKSTRDSYQNKYGKSIQFSTCSYLPKVCKKNDRVRTENDKCKLRNIHVSRPAPLFHC